MLTYEEQEAAREQRMEFYRTGGTLSPCPLCGVKRHQMTEYVRCHLCGVNWERDEDLSQDPRIERYRKVRFPNGAQFRHASMDTQTASNADGSRGSAGQ